MERKKIEQGPHEIVVQKWEESEAGWGTRPDGFSLHISVEGLAKFIKAYWDRMPDRAPQEYERPCGTPYMAGVSGVVYKQLEESGDGLRFYSNYEYPGSGGTDGWMLVRSNENIVAHGYRPPADRPWEF